MRPHDRPQRIRRILILTALSASLGIMALLWPMLNLPQPFVLNVTDSMPRGLYLKRPIRDLDQGTIVVFRIPSRVWTQYGELLRAWGWPADRDALMKPVGALAGDQVCVQNGRVRINGKDQAGHMTHDTQGNPIPHQTGCSTIQPGHFFPLSTHSPRSFDGRYFAAVPIGSIETTAVPLWTLGEDRP